jgi:hypothetical protein
MNTVGIYAEPIATAMAGHTNPPAKKAATNKLRGVDRK